MDSDLGQALVDGKSGQDFDNLPLFLLTKTKMIEPEIMAINSSVPPPIATY